MTTTHIDPTPAWKRVLAQATWDFKTAITHPEQLLLSLVLPILALFILSKSSVVPVAMLRHFSAIDTVTPGILALAIAASSFAGQAIATGFDRRADVLTFLATTPLGKSGFVTGRALSVLAQQAVQLVVIGGVAAFLGWHVTLPTAALMAVMWLLGSACLTVLGLTLAGTIRAEVVLPLANLLWVLTSGLGMVLPIGTLPQWLQPIARLLPTTALAEGLRTAAMHGVLYLPALVVLLVWLVVGYAVARRRFSWRA